MWKNGKFDSLKKKVAAINKDGSIFRIFESVHEAQRFFKVKSGNIGFALKGITKTAYGYYWKYI